MDATALLLFSLYIAACSSHVEDKGKHILFIKLNRIYNAIYKTNYVAYSSGILDR